HSPDHAIHRDFGTPLRDAGHDFARQHRNLPLLYETSRTVNPACEYVPNWFATSRSSESPSTTAARHPCPADHGIGLSVHVACGLVARVTVERTPTRASTAPSGTDADT